LIPALPLTAYCVLMGAMGILRWDHVLVAGSFLVLAYAHDLTRRFLLSFMGFYAIALLYDSGRFLSDLGVTEARVINCGLYEVERSLFGFTDGGQRVTVQDYFQSHHALAADAFFAVPYATFLAVSVLFAVWLFLKDPKAATRFSWAFFILNVLGTLTYHLAPRAPPWYLHRYGCAIHLDVAAYEGSALARVDALTGLYYFRGFYSRSTEILGALPSLHVAYPLALVLEGWRRLAKPGRGLAVFYFAWMCGAAVYLDHHWMFDVLLGWSYAVIAFAAMRRIVPVEARE
jgi:membrane-associated phospholipid phosphatase